MLYFCIIVRSQQYTIIYFSIQPVPNILCCTQFKKCWSTAIQNKHGGVNEDIANGQPHYYQYMLMLMAMKHEDNVNEAF
jgi:hypothetical protein